MIRLSIVTTMYNSELYMDKCLESLLHQDLTPTEYEIILVNDGSPDSCLSIADRYALRYSNIIVVSHENRGLAEARNSGIKVARGKYICFVDPDDYISPCSFQDLLNKMDQENLDVLRFNYQMVNEKYHMISNPKDALLIDYTSKCYTGEDFLCHKLGYACFVWSYIFKLELIISHSLYFTKGNYFDDVVWLPKTLLVANKVSSVNYIRYFYLQREGSLLHVTDESSFNRKTQGQFQLIEQLFAQSKEAKPNIKRWYKGMISKVSYSIIADNLSCNFQRFQLIIRKLRNLGVFPLRGKLITNKQSIKYILINFSSNLYYRLFHY